MDERYTQQVRKGEPRQRSDYLCAICEKPLPDAALRTADPFCSAQCCRVFHGIEIPTDAELVKGRRKQERTERPRKPNAWLIFQEPLKTGRRRRVATAEGETQIAALTEFVTERYINATDNHYQGHRFEWRTRPAKGDGNWKKWNGETQVGDGEREWRMIVSLHNGRRAHEATFTVSQHDGRQDRRTFGGRARLGHLV